MKLVLASTSAYRRELLQRFGLPFEVARPDIDESPLPGEAPQATAERLAVEKARAVAGQFEDALIIGSDQVAHMGDTRFGKPGTVERAIAQLQSMSGRTVVFHTALAVLNTRSGHVQLDAVPTEVRFRSLTDDEIVRYVNKERPRLRRQRQIRRARHHPARRPCRRRPQRPGRPAADRAGPHAAQRRHRAALMSTGSLYLIPVSLGPASTGLTTPPTSPRGRAALLILSSRTQKPPEPS
jgi:septum formation protein